MSLIGSLGSAGPSIDPSAWVAPNAVVVGRVTLGRDASVWYGAVLRADEDEIVVGPECNIQDLCCLHVDPGEPIRLAERVSLGHGVMLHGAQVGAGALIGIGAIVLRRARIGAGALVAAGTVVLPDTEVPPGVLFAGVPGKVRRELTDADRRELVNTAAGYVTRARHHQAAVWEPAGPRHEPTGTSGGGPLASPSHVTLAPED